MARSFIQYVENANDRRTRAKTCAVVALMDRNIMNVRINKKLIMMTNNAIVVMNVQRIVLAIFNLTGNIMNSIEKAMNAKVILDHIRHHIELSNHLKKVREKEIEIRNLIVDHFKEKGLNTIGTHNVVFEDYKLKISLKMNLKLDPDIIDDIIDVLPDQELECIKFKPTLKKKEYENLLPNIDGTDNIINKAIVSAPAMPSLEISLNIED